MRNYKRLKLKMRLSKLSADFIEDYMANTRDNAYEYIFYGKEKKPQFKTMKNLTMLSECSNKNEKNKSQREMLYN